MAFASGFSFQLCYSSTALSLSLAAFLSIFFLFYTQNTLKHGNVVGNDFSSIQLLALQIESNFNVGYYFGDGISVKGKKIRSKYITVQNIRISHIIKTKIFSIVCYQSCRFVVCAQWFAINIGSVLSKIVDKERAIDGCVENNRGIDKIAYTFTAK